MIKTWLAERRRKAAIRAVKRKQSNAEYRYSCGENIPAREWVEYDARLRELGDETGGAR